MRRAFDAIVVGAGQAGPSLAGRLSSAGLSVALVERKLVGGTCVNTGCIPTKAMVASAYAAQLARRAAEYGVKIEGPVRVDLASVMKRKDTVSRNARTSLESWIAGLDKCTLMRGHAQFSSPHELRVGDDVLVAERIFLNTGARASVPALPGCGSAFRTSPTATLFESTGAATSSGGGWRKLYRTRVRSDVSALRQRGHRGWERAPRLISREDPESARAIQEILEREQIHVRTARRMHQFEPRGQDVWVGLDCATGERSVLGSHVLLAVGRRPNVEDLGLENAGVTIDARGYIEVDDTLRTNVLNIWALGDCNGRGAFTHTSYNDFEIVAANLLDKAQRRVSDRVTAYALYIDPPLGRAGMSETEARKAGKRVRVGTRPMTRVGRAIEKGETQGLMKVVVDADGEQILGAAILGTGGDEAIHSDARHDDTPRRPTRRCNARCTSILPFRSSFRPCWVSSQQAIRARPIEACRQFPGLDGCPSPVREQRLDRGGGQGLDAQLRQRTRLELTHASREQHRDPVGLKSPRRECESLLRVSIHPMRVVDQAEERALLGCFGEQRQHCERHAIQIRGIVVAERERASQRRRLRLRKPLQQPEYRAQ